MFIPPGTVAGISVYALHHHDEFYPDLFTYSPACWIIDATDDGPAEIFARAQSAFAAFGLGPRGCIGANLAYGGVNCLVPRPRY
jgi:cytochrome P450